MNTLELKDSVLERLLANPLSNSLGHLDTIPKSNVLKPKDINKEDIEDSDFTITKPKFKIQFSGKTDKNGQTLINLKPNSRKAWLYSAVVPGLGQYYNHSYLKIPIIYGLFVSAILYISFNNTQYQIALTAYKTRLVNDASTNINPIQYSSIYISRDQLNTGYVQYYKKNLDFGVIATAGVWALNAIDAFVVSELKGFDVSNDLSLHVRPALFQNSTTGLETHADLPNLGPGIIPGIRLTLNFR